MCSTSLVARRSESGKRVTERLRATGVRLFLASELPALVVGMQLSPETPEQRMERRAEQRGELIFVAAGAFADLEADGRTGRLWSTSQGKLDRRTGRPDDRLAAASAPLGARRSAPGYYDVVSARLGHACFTL